MTVLKGPEAFEPVKVDSAKMQRIRDLFEAEQKNPKKAVKAEDIPETFELITEEWLTAVLGKDVPGAEVVSYTLGISGDGTANRQQYLLEWNEAGVKGGLPKSVFCKATYKLVNRLNLAFGGLDSEIAWFNSLRFKVPIETPVSYFANMNKDTYNSILLLHDMKGVDWCGYKTKVTKSMLKDMVQMLAVMHGTYWESKDPEVLALISYQSGFQGYAEQNNVHKAATDGWAQAEKVISPALFKRANNDTWEAILLATDRNAVLPQTLGHQDVHVGNWYQIIETGKMGLTDFQTMARGHHSRDLAYLMGTAPTPEDRKAWEKEVLMYYLEELHKFGGPEVDYEAFILEYKIQMFCALVSWTLTLGGSPEMPDREDWQPTDICLELIRRISIAMEQLDSYGALESIRAETPRTTYVYNR